MPWTADPKRALGAPVARRLTQEGLGDPAHGAATARPQLHQKPAPKRRLPGRPVCSPAAQPGAPALLLSCLLVAQEQPRASEEQRGEEAEERPGRRVRRHNRLHTKRETDATSRTRRTGKGGVSIAADPPPTTTGVNRPLQRQTHHCAFCRRKGMKIHSQQPTEKMHPCLSREKKFLLFALISNVST